MAILKPWTWFESTSKNVFDKDNGLIAQAGEFIGNQNFTHEESAELNVKIIDSVNRHVERTLDENTDRSKARRSIAVGWFKLVVFLVLLVVVTAFYDMELAGFFLSLLSTGVVFSVTTAVTIFFFGSYGLTRLKEAKNDK